MKLVLASLLIIVMSCNDVQQKSPPQVAVADTTGSDTVSKMNEFMRPVYESIIKVDNYYLTGDFDYDYAYIMSELKRGLIYISEIEVVKGENADVRLLAQHISTTQAAQLSNLEKIIALYDAPTGLADMAYKHNELKSEIKVMLTQIKQLPLTGNADHDFLQLMTLHHERAISMTENEIHHGKNKAIKRLAQKQLIEERKGLVELKNLLNLI